MKEAIQILSSRLLQMELEDIKSAIVQTASEPTDIMCQTWPSAH